MYKFLVPVFAAILFVAVGCTGESADHADEMHGDEHAEMSANEMLLADLEAHKADFIAALEGLSEEQLNYHESEDRWSILEVAEHIVLADQAVAAGVSGMVEAGPNPEMAPDSSVAAEQISGLLSDRGQQFQAPDEFVPTGRFSSVDEAVSAFNESHAAMVDAASNAEVDLTQHYAPNPVFGTMDASKWIVFSMSHGQRHLEQIAQVKDHEGYPQADA